MPDRTIQLVDDYQLLGIEVGAPLESARQAYRKLIKLWHPDVADAPADEAERRARELNAAFSRIKTVKAEDLATLQRKHGRKARWPGRGKVWRAGRKKSRARESAAGPGVPVTRRGRDILGDLIVTPHQAAHGSRWHLRVGTCHGCGGWGAAPGSGFEICSTCDGLGRHRAGGRYDLDRPCGRCRGHGCLFTEPCARCGGNGESSHYRVSCLLPGGLGGDLIGRLPGRGHPGLGGARAGDLLLRLIVRAQGGCRHGRCQHQAHHPHGHRGHRRPPAAEPKPKPKPKPNHHRRCTARHCCRHRRAS